MNLTDAELRQLERRIVDLAVDNLQEIIYDCVLDDPAWRGEYEEILQCDMDTVKFVISAMLSSRHKRMYCRILL